MTPPQEPTDDMTWLLDRPIAYHRCFVDLTGSVTAALLLSQALYWSLRTKDPDGWFYKTREEWKEETGMSRKEQETARKYLRACGFWQEELRTVPARMHYRLLRSDLFQALRSKKNSSWPECDQLVGEEKNSSWPECDQLVNNNVSSCGDTLSPTAIKECARVPDPDPEITNRDYSRERARAENPEFAIAPNGEGDEDQHADEDGNAPSPLASPSPVALALAPSPVAVAVASSPVPPVNGTPPIPQMWQTSAATTAPAVPRKEAPLGKSMSPDVAACPLCDWRGLLWLSHPGTDVQQSLVCRHEPAAVAACALCDARGVVPVWGPGVHQPETVEMRYLRCPHDPEQLRRCCAQQGYRLTPPEPEPEEVRDD